MFAKFSAYMRGEIQSVFDSDGGGKWPERKVPKLLGEEAKVAKIEKIRSSQYSSLSGSLRSSQRKAARLLAKTPQSDSKLTERRRKSVARYEAQLSEVPRLSQGGSKDQKGFRSYTSGPVDGRSEPRGRSTGSKEGRYSGRSRTASRSTSTSPLGKCSAGSRGRASTTREGRRATGRRFRLESSLNGLPNGSRSSSRWRMSTWPLGRRRQRGNHESL